MPRSVFVLLAMLVALPRAGAERAVGRREMQLVDVLRTRYLAGRSPEGVIGSPADEPGLQERRATSTQIYRRLSAKLRRPILSTDGVPTETVAKLTLGLTVLNSVRMATRIRDSADDMAAGRADFITGQKNQIVAHEAEARASRAAMDAAMERTARAAAEAQRARVAAEALRTRIDLLHRTGLELSAELGTLPKRASLGSLAGFRARFEAAIRELPVDWRDHQALGALRLAEAALQQAERRVDALLGRLVDRATNTKVVTHQAARRLRESIVARAPEGYAEHARGAALVKALAELDTRGEGLRFAVLRAARDAAFGVELGRFEASVARAKAQPSYREAWMLFTSGKALRERSPDGLSDENRAKLEAAWARASTIFQQAHARSLRAIDDLSRYATARETRRPALMPGRTLEEIKAALPEHDTDFGPAVQSLLRRVDRLQGGGR